MRSVTSRWLLCFVVTAGLMGVRASYAADKWLEVRSRNFILVGNASESQIRRVGRNLEEFRAGFSNLFPAISREASSPITVVVFKDDAAFRPFKPLYEGKPANVAGYFQSGPDVDYIALSADIQTPHVIYHEFVHSLSRDAAAPLPPWVSEGLAELYSMFEITGKEIILGRAVAEHVITLNNTFLSLQTLLNVQPGSPYYNEKTKQGIFYAESWA